jgi:hypothetical protein
MDGNRIKMSVYTPKQFCNPSQLGTSASTYYTVPAGTTSIVKQILLANITSSDATASIHFIPDGSSLLSSNKIFGEITISANTTQVIDLSSVLSVGATIQALAGTASAINMHISGVEAT